MEKIPSFTVNHLALEPGVYVSRKDFIGPNEDVPLTTFDLRMTAPNDEPVMGTAEVHAIEHLGATILRNDPEWGKRVIYFGPMGCRTGFYLILTGDLEPQDILDLLIRTYEQIVAWEGDVPGAAARDCGNWHDSDLNLAKWWSDRYLNKTLRVIDKAHMTYPHD